MAKYFRFKNPEEHTQFYEGEPLKQRKHLSNIDVLRDDLFELMLSNGKYVIFCKKKNIWDMFYSKEGFLKYMEPFAPDYNRFWIKFNEV